MRNTIHANRTILKVYSGIFSPLSAQRYVMPSVTVTEYLFNDVHFRIILYWYWVPVHIWWMHIWRCQNHSRYRMNAHVKMSISFLYKHFHSYESFQTIPALLFINRKVLFQPNLEILKLKWSYSSLYWPWGS